MLSIFQKNRERGGVQPTAATVRRGAHLIEGDRCVQGFTIIELLVCIVIVAALVALIVPGINTMNLKAQQATCSGNMRQVGAAVFAYSSDHDGYLPAGDHTLFWGDNLVNEGFLTTEFLRKACPTGARQLGNIGSIAYNYSVLGNNAIPGTVGLVKLAQVDLPSKTGMIIDGHNLADYGGLKQDPNNALRNGQHLVLWDKSFIRPDGSMFPIGHGSAVNVLWCDGHVSAVQKQDFYDLDKIKEMFRPSVYQPAGY